MALKYTTIDKFIGRYGLWGYVPRVQSGVQPSLETVGTGDNSATDYWLANYGVKTTSIVLTTSGGNTLAYSTDYTFDDASSKITLTAGGVTTVGTDIIYAEYQYITIGELITYTEMTVLVEEAEVEFEDDTQMYFSTTTTRIYREVENEQRVFNTRDMRIRDGWTLNYNPLLNYESTVQSAYTTGGTTIAIVSSTSLPPNGIVYIGGNKVAYTGNTANTLTIPSTTPSIAAGAVVRAEVVEVSLESQGTAPSWTVLTFDQDYEVYVDDGYVKLLQSAFFNQTTVSNTNIYSDNVRVRCSYMQVWHDKGRDPTIPDRVENCIYMMAARNLSYRVVRRAQANNIDFDPNQLQFDEKYIEETKRRYSNQNMEIR